MGRIKAVIFDLDNTLLGTDKLEFARVHADRNELIKLLPQTRLYRTTVPLLKGISEHRVPMAIVTNSPGWYTDIILNHFNISHFFKVVVTYNDVGPAGIKPHATGINKACEALGVSEVKDRVFYIGDLQSDVDASYAAGVVPLAPSWANTHIHQMPACVVSTKELIEQLPSPENLIFLAEAASHNEDLSAIKGKKFYFAPLDMNGDVIMPGRDRLEVITFGRYFTNKSEITSSLRARHKLSKDISQKDSQENQFNYSVPNYWVDIFEFILMRIGEFVYKGHQDFDVITVIPSKQGKPPRLEQLLQKVYERASLNQYLFLPGLFYFTDDAKSLKTVGGADNRDFEITRSLWIDKKLSELIEGKKVIVIDDVMTTGATLNRARKLLEEKGIERFLAVTLAKTVNPIGPQKACIKCHRPMRMLENEQGISFWGCSGYYETSFTCKHTQAHEVADCPNCNNKLVQKYGAHGFYLSHDWSLHGKNCSFTRKLTELIK
ncbi:HAD hydrolase-like protein [Pseudoalteromonas sp. 1181_04]|uniref:HAD hydrolase-like protein n=1 Tax=Pseudoalteromonas sp. 1181_04 TaxID=2604450 RepID=UPI0040627D37